MSFHFWGAQVQSLVGELKIPRVMCAYVSAKWLHSGPILCDLMDCSPSGPSVYGIIPARILE